MNDKACGRLFYLCPLPPGNCVFGVKLKVTLTPTCSDIMPMQKKGKQYVEEGIFIVGHLGTDFPNLKPHEKHQVGYVKKD